MPLLSDEVVRAEIASLNGWAVDAGELVKIYSFATFPNTIAFVMRVADIAEREGHHPDIDIRYSKVTLRLSTHSEGGITERDIQLARLADGAESA